MVGSGVAGIVLAFALLSHGSVAVTIKAEKESVMRREATRIEVQLSPSGEFMQAANGQPKEAVKIDDVDNTNLSPEELDKLSIRFCDYDFPVGKEDTNDCTKAEEKMMIDPSMCIEAGVMSGASTAHSDFYVPQGTTDRWEYKRPKGCFKEACGKSSSTHEVCYFYNGADATFGNASVYNESVEGTPVCWRPRHENGTQDAQGGCMEGYQVVEDEETCRTSANCLGLAAANEFRIGVHNGSTHLDFLQGCFVHPNGFVYYNEKSSMGLGTPGHVKGRNICNVTTTTKWEADWAKHNSTL